MITIKKPKEIDDLRIGGRILAETLEELKKYALERYMDGDLLGAELDERAGQILRERGVRSSFKNYSPPGSKKTFPSHICLSVNEEVVHGIPDDRVLAEGDVISIDLGVVYRDLYTDSAISFILGKGTEEDQRLIEVTRKALYIGIEQIRPGNRIGAIGHAIEEYVYDNGFGLVRDYSGHGVGYAVHEDPSIPNYGNPKKGEVMRAGMVLALEPMVLTGSEDVTVGGNNWTVMAEDGRRACHFEHTVVVTESGYEILTELS